ncbi:MazG nucleotide pyrophosphohydrolase domain-containing protein [Arsenicicoccus bolidensis]|uniref:Nucleotide pyrophosphohydrolase n=1 Tax=Arsenicicoccus bolidensis TaxID=229480 RepID=A0ABS9Q0E1_9MICO|nr:MazG nucleotide pyrophosphohydrolase domain-containing protein [Arsenicicoccus bolidensis]MCG7321353.1 hypothetical protein [Arsenicicoccus bolidensis]
MHLSEYQRRSATTDILPAEDLGLPILGMAGEVGSLAAEHKKRRRDVAGYRAFRDEVREDLGDLLWYAAALARRCDLDLDDVLTDNLRKTDERFTRSDQLPAHPLFDADLPSTQQLPRTLEITFSETIEAIGGRDPVPVVTIHRGASPVGDPLDDNRDDNDDYRYHDALHLGHMAVLGWSPVLRGLLKVKRKTDFDLDRIQDGGRAQAIEEGLTAYVFSVATEHSLFATTNRVPVDAIKACQRMTGHLEVARRSSADWEQAILAGYRVFRLLQQHRGGTVHADLDRRSLNFIPPMTVTTET